MRSKMKIGVYTIIANNFGAQLQAYATAKYLTEICENCKVELVWIGERHKNNFRAFVKSFLPTNIKRNKNFRNFQRLYSATRRYSCNELINIPLTYDLYVVGSDQVWNISEGIGDHLVYFLPFHTKSPKIALASSFGVSAIPATLKNKIQGYLSDFSSISVREKDGVKILADMGINADQVLDPTFWLDKNEWEKLAGDEPIIKGDYIAAIGFETSYQGPQLLMDCVKKIYGFPVIGLNTYRNFHYDIRYDTYGPKEFLNVVKFSKLVVTSSFHTLVFSLIFQKEFYLLKHTKRNSRMQNLLANLCLLERMVEGEPQNYIDKLRQKKQIDFDAVNKLILASQEETRNIINNMISRYLK